MHYVAPAFYKEAFNCPHCHAFADMKWVNFDETAIFQLQEPYDTHVARCASCRKYSIWQGRLTAKPVVVASVIPDSVIPDKDADKPKPIQSNKTGDAFQVYPAASSAPMPSSDLPDNCWEDYMEARDIFARSPRGAAALLRLVVEKLCHQLGDPSKDINQNIALLVQNGLPQRVQQALDSVRIIGNAAVHPGIMDMEDESATVSSLFRLVNIIVEKMITEPKEIEDIFESLPESRRQGIAKRDQPKP